VTQFPNCNARQKLKKKNPDKVGI